MKSSYVLGTRISGPQVFTPYDGVSPECCEKVASADGRNPYWPKWREFFFPSPPNVLHTQADQTVRKGPVLVKNTREGDGQGREWLKALVWERWPLDTGRRIWQILHNSSYCSPHQQSLTICQMSLCFFPSWKKKITAAVVEEKFTGLF